MRTVKQRGWARALGLGLLLAAGPAAAWPVDVRMLLDESERRSLELASLDWVESSAPEVVEARRSPTGALELEAKRPGQALVLLYAEGGFAVWRIVVGGVERPTLDPALQQAAADACPGLAVREDARSQPPGALKLQVDVANEACRQALLPLLKSGALLARNLSLTFSAEALQAQLHGIQRALQQEKLPLKATYVGAGLVLTGDLTAAEHRRALWTAFLNSAGKVAFEDRIRVAYQADEAPQAMEVQQKDKVEVVPLKTVREEQRRAREAQKRSAKEKSTVPSSGTGRPEAR